MSNQIEQTIKARRQEIRRALNARPPRFSTAPLSETTTSSSQEVSPHTILGLRTQLTTPAGLVHLVQASNAFHQSS